MTLQAVEIDVDAGLEFDTDRVIAPAGLHNRYIRGGTDNSLAEQEARREVAVVPGRAHRYRYALRAPLTFLFEAETDLERLLDSYPVVGRFAQIAADLCDLD